MKKKGMDPLLREVQQLPEKIDSFREILLANLIMIGQIPAPVFKERRRVRFLLDRFLESNLADITTDEVGNAFGLIRGEENAGTILLLAHLDTLFGEEVDHNMQVTAEHVMGPTASENSLGVAVLATLPLILERLDIKLKHNILLMGSVRSLERGDIEGIRSFLEHRPPDIRWGVCLESVQLGRLSHFSMAMRRVDISCNLSANRPLAPLGPYNAIVILNEIINEIATIPVPQRPRSAIALGIIRGGTMHGVAPRRARLGLELRSESDKMVDQLWAKVRDAVADVRARRQAPLTCECFSRRKAAAVRYSHPLVKAAANIMRALEITPQPLCSVSELSAILAAGITAITLAISEGEEHGEAHEKVAIKPVSRGVAQIIGVLLAIDRGLCDGD